MKIIFSILLLVLNFHAFGEEFKNFCTTSLSEGNFTATDCFVNQEFDGKTYCFGNQTGKDIFLENPQEVIKKAEKFFLTAFNDERIKLSQEEVDNILDNDPECDLSNKDVGYLNFNGKDLTHCKMVNISFFGADLRGQTYLAQTYKEPISIWLGWKKLIFLVQILQWQLFSNRFLATLISTRQT